MRNRIRIPRAGISRGGGRQECLLSLILLTLLVACGGGNDRLKAAGVPTTLVIVKNAGHGFIPTGGKIDPSAAELTRMLVAFFDQHLPH